MYKCGSCCLCCKILWIPELEKPAGVWCQHCKPGNKRPCSIYDKRYPVCKAFQCSWLKGDLPVYLSPLLTHCVLREGNNLINITVDTNTDRALLYFGELIDAAIAQGIRVQVFREEKILMDTFTEKLMKEKTSK